MFQPAIVQPAHAELRAAQARGAAALRDAAATTWGVIVIGCGVTGATAAWQLAHAARPPPSVLLVDVGTLGAGTHERYVAPAVLPPPRAAAAATDERRALGEEAVYHAGNSGGVVFSAPHFPSGPGCTKYVLTLYNVPTPEFVEHHGEAGARAYLRLAARGVSMTLLCKRVLPNAVRDGVLEEVGSMMLGAPGAEEAAMREEYEALRGFGADVAWWGAPELAALHGREAGWACGILFPNDARVDSLAYVRGLVADAEACAGCRVRAVAHAPALVDVRDEPGAGPGGGVVAVFADGTRLRAAHAVVATNGLYLDMNLAGLVTPRWSYFLAVPHPVDAAAAARAEGGAPRAAACPGDDRGGVPPTLRGGAADAAASAPPPLRMGGRSSLNFFTYGFAYDWAVTRGVLRISGLDHISALKPPRAAHQARLLAEWVLAKYPYTRAMLCPAGEGAEDAVHGRFVYGVYAETPDALPIVGVPREGSRVCYVVGCNAAGQSVLSYAASIVPGLLGYDDLSDEDVGHARFLAMTRFTTQAAYLRGKL